MNQPQSPQIRFDKALEAAGVCVWEWKQQGARLSLRARGNVLPELTGDWKLADFLSVLDGLSAGELTELLTNPPHEKPDIKTVLTLADGKKLQVLGGYLADGRARGLIYALDHRKTVEHDARVEAVYQPIIRLEDGAIAGFEALARWRAPDGTLKSAGELEGAGSLLSGHDLALSMLEQASEALARWRGRFPELDLFIQVNLSGADLYRGDVLEKVGEICQSDAFPASAIKLELTEQMALRDFDAGIAAASALQASGASLILDDFGSGHSSLAWLAAIPAAGIKLDPQLTQMRGKRIDLVLAGIAKLARKLDLSITAEGIEDFERVEFLRKIGCDYVQGFAYARPMEVEAADRFLVSQSTLGNLTTTED